MRKALAATLCLAFLSVAVLPACGAEETIAPTKKIVLFNGKDFTGWKLFLPGNADVTKTWSVKNGVIHCKGRPIGYMRTEKAYRNYKIHLEWRWPARPGNSGCLVHMSGPDKVWPKSLECQLQHRSAGDFWVIGGVEFKEHAAKSPRVKGRRTIKNHKSNEKPLGQWNVMEVVCKGDVVKVYVNGLLQNTATNCREPDGKPLTKGKICLQSEGAPVEFRNIYLEPAK